MDLTTETSEAPKQKRLLSGGLMLLFIAGFLVLGVVSFLLPAPFSSILLTVLVVGSLGAGVFHLVLAPALTPPLRWLGVQIKSPALRTPFEASRGVLAALFALLSFSLMIAAALDLRTANDDQFLGNGTLKLLLGGLALGPAIWLAGRRVPALAKPLDFALTRGRLWGYLLALVGVVLLALVAEISAMVFHITLFEQVPVQLQFAMLMGGMLLVGYGLGGAPSLRIHLSGVPRATWLYALAVIAIIALAFFVRTWNQSGTMRYLIDELHFSDGIVGVESRPFLPILTQMSGEAPYTWIFSFWQSGAVAILGHNFDGFRFVSAVCGTLTVLAGFGLADALFDRKTALLAALVLATFPPQINFSRVAMVIIAEPVFGTMALMFIVRALKNNHRIEWTMAGVSLGLTQYFYDAGRLLYPPLVIAFLVLLALRKQLHGKWRGILLMLVTAVVISLPVYYVLVGIGRPLYGRYDVSGMDMSFWQQLFSGQMNTQGILNFVSHLLSGFEMYGSHADIAMYYGGQQALILDYLLPFFLFGAFYLAWRYPAPAALIPLWILATALGNGLLRDTLNTARYIVVYPALAIAIAAGVRYLLPFFEPSSDPNAVRKRRTLVRQAVPVMAVGAISAAQVGYYFGPHLQYFNVQVRDAKGYRDGIDAANRVPALPGNTQPFLVGYPVHDQNVPRDWMGFLAEDGGNSTRYFPLLTVPPDTFTPKYLIDLPAGVNYAFFVDPNATNAMAQIVRYFPKVSPPQYSIWDIPAHKEYVLFYVSSEDIPVRPRLHP